MADSTGNSLDHQVILITGGARRIGAQIARTLHAAGGRILLHYRSSTAAAKELGAELNAARPGSVALIAADLQQEEAPEQLIAAALGHFGRLDVLINNASTFYPTPVGKITRAAWDDLIGSNLRAPLFLAQAAAPHLAKQRGVIINVVDIHGLRPLKGYPVYSIAKAGLAPGPVLWAEHDLDDSMKREIIARTTLKRTGSPQDIARTALFLIRDASYITGQIIAVDGGRSI
jgi:pteridine reductase